MIHMKISLVLCVVITQGVAVVCNKSNELQFKEDLLLNLTSLNTDHEVCPQWSYCINGSCHCPANQYFLFCDHLPNLVLLMCSCITYKQPIENTRVLEFGFCMYNCDQWNSTYVVVPQNISYWNEYECGKFHRTGTLCGSCDEENSYYQRVYSFDVTCIRCSNTTTDWIKYLLSAFLPLTIFCFVILIFRINIHSSALQGLVTFCQFVSLPTFFRILFQTFKSNRVFETAKLLGSLFGIWNLDFFRMYYNGYCLRIGSLATLSLEFSIAVYPLLLVMATYGLIGLYDRNFKPLVLLWKPFKWLGKLCVAKWDLRTSAIDLFSTFFFLSNMKFLSSSFDLLVPVKVHQFTDAKQVHHVWRLYYDANIPYLQGTHLYYAILAIMVLTIFVFFPVLLLLFYPFKLCQICLSKLPNRVVLPLHIFVDSFQGCYKDGTEPGTRDCRWFSAGLIIFRFMYITICAACPNEMVFPLSSIGIIIFVLIIVSVDPFKPSFYNTKQILIACMLFEAISSTTAVCIAVACLEPGDWTDYYIFIFMLLANVLFPILLISGFALQWIITNRKA